MVSDPRPRVGEKMTHCGDVHLPAPVAAMRDSGLRAVGSSGLPTEHEILSLWPPGPLFPCGEKDDKLHVPQWTMRQTNIT